MDRDHEAGMNVTLNQGSRCCYYRCQWPMDCHLMGKLSSSSNRAMQNQAHFYFHHLQSSVFPFLFLVLYRPKDPQSLAGLSLVNWYWVKADLGLGTPADRHHSGTPMVLVEAVALHLEVCESLVGLIVPTLVVASSLLVLRSLYYFQ